MVNLLDAEARARAKEYSGSGSWLDEANSHDAALPGGSNDPTWFDHDETQADNYFRHPGSNGNWLSLADSAALSVTGDLDLRWVGILPDWTPASNTGFITKWQTSGNDKSFIFQYTVTGGLLRFLWTEDGSAVKLKSASVATGITDGTLGGVRFTFDVDNGSSDADLKFYTLDDPANDDPEDASKWTQLGNTITNGAATSISDEPSLVGIGATENAGTGDEMTGETHRALMYDGIDGTLVLDINPADEDGDTVAQAGTFAESSSEGATVTINQSGTAELCRIVDRPAFQNDTDDRLEIPDDAALDYTHTDSFTWGLGFRVYDTSPSADAVLIGKKANLTTADGYVGYLESSDAKSKGLLADGSNEQTATSGNLTDGKAHTLIWVYNGSTTQAYLDGSASGSASSDNVSADMANAVALVFASISGGGSYAQVEIWSYAVISQELSASEVGTGADTLHDNLLKQTVPSAGETVTPAAIVTSTTMPAPSLTHGTTVSPSAIATTTTMPAPTLTYGAGLAPATITTSTTMPAPTITYGAGLAPATIVTTTTMPAPALTYGTTVSPSAVVTTTTMPAPMALSINTISPAAIVTSTTIPTVALQGGPSPTPATIVTTTVMPAPTITYGAGLAPATIVTTTTMPAPEHVGTPRPTAQFVLMMDTLSRFVLEMDTTSRFESL